MRSIFKCACGNVSLTENGNRCPICGDLLVKFSLPSIEPQPSRVDLKRVMYGSWRRMPVCRHRRCDLFGMFDVTETIKGGKA